MRAGLSNHVTLISEDEQQSAEEEELESPFLPPIDPVHNDWEELSNLLSDEEKSQIAAYNASKTANNSTSAIDYKALGGYTADKVSEFLSATYPDDSAEQHGQAWARDAEAYVRSLNTTTSQRPASHPHNLVCQATTTTH